MSQPTLYEILSLSPTSDLSPAQIKQAYRRALLTHHPDKSSTRHQSSSSSSTTTTTTTTASTREAKYTIDQISHAYTTLSSPLLKTKYDASLRTLQRSFTNPHSTEEDFQTGIDTIDLDELEFLEGTVQNGGNGKDTWYRSCRCGNERGFALTEEDLEENADLGEVLVQCQDCTIWLRVVYVVAEDDEEEDEEKVGNNQESGEKR
ncbi:hypothetical protein B0T20DRAFT_47182 [Sordaria brevicollis]|uniref:Diphthamide biosynthesis protein 4 n=1 Tax=Sordaria brevicollis TaxID=83679 RepID=A0AAE0P9J7_SORBR|nr:hypothetical protein B0T20DRAFT_47182 [Sordaria brevicollis]